MAHDDLFVFDDEAPSPVADASRPAWQVLIVDDDEDVHLSTRFALRDLSVMGRPLALQHAYSAAEARERLSADDSIAVMLLDVVMETDSAGLDLVDEVRRWPEREALRIILRTGQPGQAPEQETLLRYDINDYRSKAEITQTRLLASLVTALRSHEQITALKRSQDALQRLAYQDALTGLLSRQGLLAELREVGNDDAWRIALVDIDHFGTLNDLFGSHYGDQVLQAVADRLRKHHGPRRVARVGSDVFAVIGPAHSLDAESLRQSLQEPLRLGASASHRLLFSLGLALLDDPRGTDPLQGAFMALKKARGTGLAQTAEFTPQDAEVARQRLMRLTALQAALEQGQLAVVYQPIVRLPERRLCGFEALVRWPQADGSTVPPDQFIALAEESGLIVDLGDWVLRQSLAFLSVLHQQGMQHLKASVNLSVAQFRHPRLIESIQQALKISGVPAGCLQLEVTESICAPSGVDVRERLLALANLGVAIAIDDFGTGFSSLAYLDSLGAHHLKLDRSFVTRLDQPQPGAPIAALVLDLARTLGMGVVAEGVETPAQAAYLEAHGCPMAQGFLFGRPMMADDFMHWLRKH